MHQQPLWSKCQVKSFSEKYSFLDLTNSFLTLLSRCVNEGGSHKCTCPRGSTGEPYTIGCTGSSRVECEVDQDCPGQLACQDSACINPCSTLPCGENAVCVPEDHAAWCRYMSTISNNSSLIILLLTLFRLFIPLCNFERFQQYK